VLHDLVVALFVFGGASLALFIGAVAYARWRLRRQLRVRPSTRSVAPTSWLVSTSEPARLHRRLRKAAAVARTAGARGDTTIASLAAEIEDLAVALETHLVLLSRLWRQERGARAQLVAQVKQLEQLSARLTVSAVEGSRPRSLSAGSPDALAELTERIDALDAARKELAQLERSWNLNA
jgi:DNA-binding helix-hairpin-helix protein with protein kinase domain